MPPVNTTSCPELNLPGVTTLPGYLSVVASVCFFYPSIQYYAGTVRNGILQEETAKDPIPLLPGGPSASPVSESLWNYGFSNPCLVENQLYYTNTSFNHSNIKGGLVVVDDMTVPQRCVYGFNSHWKEALEDNGLSDIIFGGASGPVCYPSTKYDVMTCDNTWWLGNIFNGGNATISSINTFLNTGFKSFTNQIRTYGKDWHNNTLVASGTMMETTVCTEFNWVWLIYPLVLLFATFILFIAVLLSSSGMFGYVEETIWKSSVLPLLFYGLEDQHRQDGLRLSTTKELGTLAKKLKVDFSTKGSEWRLHAVDTREASESSRNSITPEGMNSHQL
ncbi:hypothetical protein PG991_000703 [Apiospora marii]|uniref:Uncharacterized protein n=2 Tax=Apiospora marii TaxID=335849 RepID=A0ABR1ST04_9PEZI